MRNTKKGFTIIELVVVVAVIAILAAVLIPTFSGIIAKAKLNADEQTVANMNKYVAAADAEKEFVFAADAVNALYDNGFNLGKFKTFSKGYHYAYDFEENRFYLLDAASKVVFPANSEDKDVSALWGFFNNEKSDKIEGVTKYIATSAVFDANLFNAYDCVFASEITPYTLDLNQKSITVAAKGTAKNITLKNGSVLDTIADGYTLDSSATKKASATPDSIKDITPVEGVVTIENAIFSEITESGKLEITDFGATKVVLKNCTIDLSGKNADLILGDNNVTDYVIENCVINLDAKIAYVLGNANKPNVTIKDCTISSGRGFVIGVAVQATDTAQFGEILIEGNTFIDNGTAEGKPSLQFSAAKAGDTAYTFSASKITIKNNDFLCKDIAVRIHETIKTMVCSNLTISGNTFAVGAKIIDGDDASQAQAIADAWLPKFN